MARLQRPISFEIGEEVKLKTDPDKKRIITGFRITKHEVKYEVSFVDEYAVYNDFEIQRWTK